MTPYKKNFFKRELTGLDYVDDDEQVDEYDILIPSAYMKSGLAL